MSKTGARLYSRILRYLGKFIRLILLAAIYALVIWYGVITTAHLNTLPILTEIAIAFIALGIAGSSYTILTKIADEVTGAIMVLADFLNRHLLDPQKRRLIDQGRAQGRAEERAEIVALMRAKGINPDDIIPRAEPDNAEQS